MIMTDLWEPRSSIAIRFKASGRNSLFCIPFVRCVAILPFILVMSNLANADMVRGLENYLKMLKGETKMESLSPMERLEILEIHERLSGFGTTSMPVGACRSVIESQIEGEFTGWDGGTIFKLSNGQIWEQTSYSYTYHYAYMPEVTIYPSGGYCNLKVEGLDDTITVRRLR